MKKLIIFVLFISAVTCFIFLPVYAFRISDNAIYQVPLQRTAQFPPLSEEGEKNDFAKSMFSRKNIYGPRFLSWAQNNTVQSDIFDVFLEKLTDLCTAKVLDEAVLTEYEQLIKDPQTTATFYSDIMYFNRIQLSSANSHKNATMEINTSALSVVYSLQLTAEISSDISLDSFISYLSLDSFTDWQYLSNKAGAYSAKAQLYVYVQSQNNYISLGAFPMTAEEFSTYN